MYLMNVGPFPFGNAVNLKKANAKVESATKNVNNVKTHVQNGAALEAASKEAKQVAKKAENVVKVANMKSKNLEKAAKAQNKKAASLEAASKEAKQVAKKAENVMKVANTKSKILKNAAKAENKKATNEMNKGSTKVKEANKIVQTIKSKLG